MLFKQWQAHEIFFEQYFNIALGLLIQFYGKIIQSLDSRIGFIRIIGLFQGRFKILQNKNKLTIMYFFKNSQAIKFVPTTIKR